MFSKILVAAVALTTGVTYAQSHQTETATLTTNRLGLEIMREVVAEQKVPRNTMVSPISAQIALAMAYNGTAGATRAQMQQRIGAPSADNLNASNLNLQHVLSRPKVAAKNDWSKAPPALFINNGAWTNNGATDNTRFALSDKYKKVLAEDYRAHMKALDFKQPSAADKINDWVKAKTLGLIPKITDASALEQYAWVLINTTYLEASWEQSFYKLDSQEPNFTLASGEKKTAQMIGNLASYRYIANPLPSVEAAIEIPLADDGPTKLAMYAVLPAVGQDFLALQKSTLWESSFWQDLAKKIQDSRLEDGRITLPKFSFSDSFEMSEKSPLTSKLGLGFLFARTADFSAMATPDSQPTIVGLIKQNTRVELDEKGVKAAAATVVGGVVRASPIRQNFDLNFNRPFVYALVDQSTGALLFVGAVADPTAN